MAKRKGEHFLWSKVEEREKMEEIPAGRNYKINRGEKTPGAVHKRLLPFLEDIWRRVFCHSKDKRLAGSN